MPRETSGGPSPSPEASPSPRARVTRQADIERALEALPASATTERSRDLQYVGAGGTSVVFDVPGHPELVAKVDAQVLAGFIRTNLENHLSPEAVTPELLEALDKQAQQSKDIHDQLKRFFGAAVLPEKTLRWRVPVTQELLTAVKKPYAAEGLEPDKVYKLWTLIRQQQRLPEAALKPDSSYSFTSGYMERRNVSEEAYERFNEDLLDGPGDTAVEYLSQYPELKAVAERCQHDESLRNVIRDFTADAMLYTRVTNEIVDVVGRSNLRLYKDQERWKILMVDGVYPERAAWEKTGLTVMKARNGREITRRESLPTVNGLNYARFINALAAISGNEKRLRIPGGIGDTAAEIMNAFKADAAAMLKPGHTRAPKTRRGDVTKS